MRIAGPLVVTLLAGQAGHAQTSSLTGSVLDAMGKPVVGAEISIGDAGLAARANWSGDFEIRGVPLGKHLVVIRKSGYLSDTATITFLDSRTIERDFVMVTGGQVDLPAVSVKAASPARGRLADFEERRAAGFGHFIGGDELRRNESKRMADLLVRVPGAAVSRGRNGEAWIAGGRGHVSIQGHQLDKQDAARGARPQCYALVWLDGVLVYGYRDREPLFDVNSVSPADLEAIEYYAGGGQVPTKLAGSNAACGVLVLWTRGR